MSRNEKIVVASFWALGMGMLLHSRGYPLNTADFWVRHLLMQAPLLGLLGR